LKDNVGIHLCGSLCNPSYSGGRDQEAHSSKPVLGKYFARPYLKNTQLKKGWQVAQVVERLPHKQEALISNPVPQKKKKKKNLMLLSTSASS
jgi:hypothetical protein